HRHGVDARASLKLPQRLAVLGVERDELAGLLTGEQEAAAGRQHRRPVLVVIKWHPPALLAGEWVDRVHMADGLAVRRHIEVFDKHEALAGPERLRRQPSVEPAFVNSVDV